MYPDVVLTSPDRGRRVHAVIEVEYHRVHQSPRSHGAMGIFWTPSASLPFVRFPAGAVDVAKRLCSDNGVAVAEIQSYHLVGDQDSSSCPCTSAPADSRFQDRERWFGETAVDGAPVAPRRAGVKTVKRPAAAAGRARRAKRPAKTAPVPSARGEAQIALATPAFFPRQRGYETTFLVHSFRSRGSAGQPILTSFDAPDVKVGRAALDEARSAG